DIGHYIIQFIGIDTVEFIGGVRDQFQYPEQLSIDRNGGQDGRADPLIQKVPVGLLPGSRPFKALLHIGYGKVLLLLYQFSMGTVAEHHIAGFHVLVVQQVAFHSPAIDLEKMVGAQVVSGKTDLDVLEPEQGPENVLEAFHEAHTPLGVPPDQGRFDLGDGMFRGHIEHIGDDKALGNKTSGRNLLLPQGYIVKVRQELIHVPLGQLRSMFRGKDLHEIGIVQNAVAVHHPIGIRNIIEQGPPEVEVVAVVELEDYTAFHDVVVPIGKIVELQLEILPGILYYFFEACRGIEHHVLKGRGGRLDFVVGEHGGKGVLQDQGN